LVVILTATEKGLEMARKTKGSDAVQKQANALETLTVEYVPIADLSPNDYNPNRQSDHDFELLIRSMTEDGFTQPIVAQREGQVIVDGEHRWRAAQRLGYESVPVVFVDMTVEQMKIATLRHNRARGSEDIDLASSVLRDLAALGALDWAQDSLMMDDVELERLLEDVPAPEALAGEEFSDAWEPTPEVQGAEGVNVPTTTQTTTQTVADGSTEATSMTGEALEAARQRERELATAKTQEERDRIQQEAASFYRLALMFQGKQADLVQHVLGTQAADKLLEIIGFWLEGHPEDALEGD